MNQFQKIKQLLSQLDEQHQQTVLDYATYLVQQYGIDKHRETGLEPAAIERPKQETVIAAIKRLKKTYTMLDTDIMLSETSALMGQHILKGRAASAVIDELQSIFRTRYEQYLNR
jgi:chitinase